MRNLKITSTKLFVPILAGLMFFVSACQDDLLDQQPTTELGTVAFWKTEDDATFALYGAYAGIRPLFDRDYYFEGHGEYTRVRGTSATSGNLRLGDAYQGANYDPSGYGDDFDKYYRYLYGGVHRANYVIENTRKLMATANPNSQANLERIVGEARLLRGMVYFRLISMWGDVPYISNVVTSNAQIADIARMPIGQVKDSIMADFTYAYEKLPVKSTELGRMAKPAALAFRGKLQLYWGSWNKNGWPELEGFTPNATAANEAFTAAAADFKQVIEGFGLNLFRNGEPGNIDALGKAEVLPNYYYLFTPVANGDPEMIMYFTHGGPGTSQGEELMRDFSGRSHEGSQCWVSPRYELADRYQLTTTGDFAPAMVPMNPSTNAAARTVPNSAVNPQSYADRDYRMKASIMWDYEMSIGMAALKSTGWTPFIYRTWAQPVTIDGARLTTYNTDGSNSGYVFRKFLRNYAGQGRSDGDYAFPVMRLADVYLMYAEATNEVNGPQADAIALVDKIRHRGNLPALTSDKTSSKEAFFNAIEQERIIELVAEGHRGFDLRRWRALDRVWGPPASAGVWRIDTWGAQQTRYYQNTPERTYQQNYIFRIPPGERDRNPNLTQNTPWL
ncbi:RagB/SusD family nutrient uptake outer membrane protein [Adhaeribacter rhizoryzae]|uniref:RagB/SusD family nutrient uptake outer membrane protein n=1 Tax=Adhaeribacter rhizoryzae TaxID=2607907 RepID=A0A5M6D5S4_9BACT|nr:RagB/SusD family nutrient uptake outer membrane protein [Adhaeribacter rhizoryzae]KAA5542858.1 RagB/SusD family nutrient uptake outer membrane protein [Adhaeribacter rhizoryzae]